MKIIIDTGELEEAIDTLINDQALTASQKILIMPEVFAPFLTAKSSVEVPCGMVEELEEYCRMPSPWKGNSEKYANGMHESKRHIKEIIYRNTQSPKQQDGLPICTECGGNGYVLERSGYGEEQEPQKCLNCGGKGIVYPQSPKPVEQEPLACLADRKGFWVNTNCHNGNWCVNMERNEISAGSNKAFSAIERSFKFAESKARQYLESLPDVKSK